MKGDKRECSPKVHFRAPETKHLWESPPLTTKREFNIIGISGKGKDKLVGHKETDAVTVHWALILMTFTEDKAALGYSSTHSSHHHQSMFTQNTSRVNRMFTLRTKRDFT